jgi:thioredoxin-like negative regulator of GroEL
VSAPTPFVSPYAYEWFVRAELARSQGDSAGAAEAYESALTSGDDDPYLLARLAEAREASGDHPAADRALASALERDPSSEAAWLARGRIALQRGDQPGALAAFARAEQVAPGSSEAPAQLAEVLRAQGHPERAIAVLERASQRGPRTARAALRARLELARARHDGAALAAAAADWLAYAGADLALLRRTAAELFAAGEPVLAERVLQALPDDGHDALLRLQVALALRRNERALLLLASNPPEAFGGSANVADAFLQLGKPDRALAQLDEREHAEGDDAPRRTLLLGMCKLALGDPAAAAELLARVPAGSSYFTRARQELAHALQSADMPALAGEVASKPLSFSNVPLPVPVPLPAPTPDPKGKGKGKGKGTLRSEKQNAQ